MTSYAPEETRNLQLLGHQSPRIGHWVPSPRSAGQEVIELAAMAGLYLDPWQQLVLDKMLGIRRDGQWTAREVGLCVSRQNGKGSILEALELGSLFLLDEEMCIHSAHLFDTSLEAFNRVLGLIENTPDLYCMVKRVARSHGEEGIEVFREGKKRRLRFKARSKGSGRGFTADRIIIDEAMFFDRITAAALIPVVSARPNSQIVCTGSAGDKTAEYFGRMRARGITGLDPRLCYLEWSIDACTEFCEEPCREGHDRSWLDNELELSEEELEIARAELVSSYAKANPGLGIRISLETCESERMSMGKEAFLPERLGIGDWPVEGEAWRVIDQESWMNRYDELSRPEGPFSFAIDTTPDRRYSCIAVAGANGEGAVHGEITGYLLDSGNERLDHRPGTDWVVPRAIEIAKRNRPCTFTIDKGSQAGGFVDELEAAGVRVLSPTGREYAQGCGTITSMILPRKVGEIFTHRNQPNLTAAVSNAEKRDLADLWAWDKRNAAGDISPLVAMTLAVWGHHQGVHTKRFSPSKVWG